MPSSTKIHCIDEAKPQATQQLNKEGRAQPWKEFIDSGSNGLGKREGDFITIHATKDANGKKVQDLYTAQIG
ncbi:hypothetical protein F5Y19DRAFT_469730 [Xylariaceae sp. FL1651]|nr:hypothetical protein F5Y19DRAFT_469730 [Xylariaceae sp. FL1651]